MKSWVTVLALGGLISICGFILPSQTMAQSVPGMAVTNVSEDYIRDISYSLEQPFGGKGSVANLAEYVQLVYQFALGIVGIFAVVLIMYGGLRWVAAAGNESTIGEAKEVITSAVIGLMIALFSYIILLAINPAIITTGIAVPKIPIPTEQPSVLACANGTINESTGARYCKTTSTRVSSADLNSWIMQYKGAVSPTFIKAIMKTESGFCIDAKSNIKGDDGSIRHACGLMQVMPTTATAYAAKCGVPECMGVTSDVETDPKATACCNALTSNPEKAVCMGASHLNTLQTNTYTKGDLALMAAAYNGGTCNSSKSNGALCPSKSCAGQLMYQCEKNSGYAETRKYVTKVTENNELLCTSNFTTCRQMNIYRTTAADYACKRRDGSGYTYARCGVDASSGSSMVKATCINSNSDLINVGCKDPYFVNFNVGTESSGVFSGPPQCGVECKTSTCGL